ncbi:RNA polymerase subunit sigma-70 [Microbacterium binotii]|uniref:Sigma-70 family RNA polymerase sigma factor SigG n=1 Tax=Microbacterium binotii TaxID=462710 RepID=A0ABN3P7E1_9MICO
MGRNLVNEDADHTRSPLSQARFESELGPLRAELHAHCYRMLGSVYDADDALQNGLLRAWRAYRHFDGRSSIRTWLYTIVTRTCIDEATARGRRALPIDLGPASPVSIVDAAPHSETAWLTPYPDPAEHSERASDVELAFVAVLQQLSGNERAAFLLADILGFSAPDIAEILSTSPASVHSALGRARRALARGDRPMPPTRPDQLRLARRFARALASSDLPAFLALLAPDVTWQMPPLAAWYAGADAVAAFAHAVPMTLCPSWRTQVLTANGQPAVAFYLGEADGASHKAWSLTVISVERGRITEIASFLDPTLFARFGLPDHIV